MRDKTLNTHTVCNQAIRELLAVVCIQYIMKLRVRTVNMDIATQMLQVFFAQKVSVLILRALIELPVRGLEVCVCVCVNIQISINEPPH